MQSKLHLFTKLLLNRFGLAYLCSYPHDLEWAPYHPPPNTDCESGRKSESGIQTVEVKDLHIVSNVRVKDMEMVLLAWRVIVIVQVIMMAMILLTASHEG